MAEVYLRANPSRPRELIREALEANLEPDEELRWFSIVKQFRLPAPLRWHPWLQLFAVKHWYVGITPERVLFGRVKFAGEPDPSGVITVPVADVTVGRRGQSGGELLVANPKGGLPRELRLADGLDIDELEEALGKFKDVTAVWPAGWLADPTGRHELRYWDGTAWTAHVSDTGAQSGDPV